ncbi:MAG TPA: COX15/CtaA family protein [Hyphomicrobiaceae bacterium]|nr:COX15/CtaA family protein [Alphaproteobacteria bacterium]HRY08147.1 COX15/CtaA family protein [Hyphomicrobiaceae bacterium]
MDQLNDRQRRALPLVRSWLFLVAFLIFCMVIVGGATRLTDSGLSITEWQPLLGAIPPLNEADWLSAFEKYKLIPEYTRINQGMSLEEFKFIYWWEWSHRFLGRFIGVVFFLPFIYFAVTGALSSRMLWRFGGIFVLGALQGALGWYMVASGLVDRVDVSQYRLAAHLTLATAIFAAVLWVAYGLGTRRRPPLTSRDWVAVVIVGLVVLQVAAGGFVAGLDAGMGYNTWPMMDGQLVPDGLFIMSPAWRNMFENAMTVQFNHRLMAYVIFVVAAGYAYVAQTKTAALVMAAVLLQAALGIWALLWQVPLWLGLVHQGGALIVLATALWNLHTVLRRSPGPDRR